MVNQPSEMDDETSEKLSFLKRRLEHHYKLLRQYYTNLHSLKEQEALYGILDVPIHLQSQIQGTLSKIKDVEEEIRRFEHAINEIEKKTTVRSNDETPKEKDLFDRFWQIHNNQSLFCAVSTLADRHTGWYKRPMTGFGEIRGYASIVYSLTRAYKTNITKDARLFFSDSFPMTHLEDSLILLGGDDKNSITAKMFHQFRILNQELPFEFICEKQQDDTGQKKETGVKYLECKDEKISYKPQIYEDRIVDDFGVVARLPNPFNWRGGHNIR